MREVFIVQLYIVHYSYALGHNWTQKLYKYWYNTASKSERLRRCQQQQKMVLPRVVPLLLIIQCTCLAMVPPRTRLAHQSYLQAINPINDDSIFEVIAGNLANCLILSDVKRMTGNDGASTGWTSWVEEKSCFRLQKCIDKLSLVNPKSPTDPSRIDLLEQRDEAQRWIRWMKNSPAPMIIEVSDELRRLVNATLEDASLEVRSKVVGFGPYLRHSRVAFTHLPWCPLARPIYSRRDAGQNRL